METKREIKQRWNPGMGGIVYDLTIPAGTPVVKVANGTGPGFAVTATREMLPEAERAHSGPVSLFAWDAEHRWVWVEESEVVQ